MILWKGKTFTIPRTMVKKILRKKILLQRMLQALAPLQMIMQNVALT